MSVVVDFKSLHGAGRCSVAYASVPGHGLCLVTAGADGQVTLRGADSLEQKASHTEAQPIECLVVDPNSNFVAVGVDNRTQVGGWGQRAGAWGPLHGSPPHGDSWGSASPAHVGPAAGERGGEGMPNKAGKICPAGASRCMRAV
jgi:hypothetical protein